MTSRVYPTLREQCKLNGCQLVVVDLVWGTLQDQTRQSVYTNVVQDILTKDPDAILVVS